MKSKTKQLSLIALFLALCVIIPFLFHVIGAGTMLLPMFIPIVLAGFIIEFPYVIFVGLLGPWISTLITGMPPLFPTTLIMSIEGITVTGVVSYFYFRKRYRYWICLIMGVFLERVSLIVMGFIIAPLLHLPGELFSVYKLIESFPGVILQLILIPIVLKILWKFNVVSK